MGSDRKMGHVQSFKTYLLTFIGLLALTVVTVLVSYKNFGAMNEVVALGVATMKASLVVMIFMHGRYENKITWAFIYYPLIIVGLLVGGVFLDYMNRGDGWHGQKANFVSAVEGGKYPDAHGDDHGDASGDHSTDEAHSEDADHAEGEEKTEESDEASADQTEGGETPAESGDQENNESGNP